MEILNANGFTIKNLGKINIILGKNGCGKSNLLKKLEEYMTSEKSSGRIKYITPERGGKLTYDPGIDSNISGNEKWLPETRRTNQFVNFRQQSVAQFRNLELLFYREKEENSALSSDPNHKFLNYFNKINDLLDNIELKRDKSSFKIYKKGTDTEIKPELISSGESELISLGIECLVFEKECDETKTNILFLDEPDVHLHPDLQARLSHFLYELVKTKNIIVILATHSTAILGALERFDDTHIEFMIKDQVELNFKKISEEYRKILPVFGAHPLSNIFNDSPILLVEGEDDERIWQRAVRTSNQKLKIYPCSTNGISNMGQYETDVENIIKCVYEGAKSFSLRDRDDEIGEIENLSIIIRFRLSCRASENLLLSNEVLQTLNFTWDQLIKKIDTWLDKNQSHDHHAQLLAFKSSGYDRKNHDLKKIRNDLMHIMGKNIGWEIAIGKTLGKLISTKAITSDDENGIFAYLGEKITKSLFVFED